MKSTRSALRPRRAAHERASTLQSRDARVYQTLPPIVGGVIKRAYTRSVVASTQALPVTPLVLANSRRGTRRRHGLLAMAIGSCGY